MNNKFVNDLVKEVENNLEKQNLLPSIPKKGSLCEWCHEEKKGFALQYYNLEQFSGWYCVGCSWCASLAKEQFDRDDS